MSTGVDFRGFIPVHERMEVCFQIIENLNTNYYLEPKSGSGMKKLFVAAIALLFIKSLDAQVRFGIKAGGNLANMNDFDNSKMRLGINAGPFLQINFAKHFFIQPELLYSLKGFQSPNSAPSFSDPATINLNYINLPVLLGFRATKNFSIKLGPEIGHLLSAKSKTDFGSRDMSKIYDDFDFGADLGLSYSLKKISLDLRYNYGFKNILHGMRYDQYGYAIGEGDFGSNRVLQFSLCYFLK